MLRWILFVFTQFKKNAKESGGPDGRIKRCRGPQPVGSHPCIRINHDYLKQVVIVVTTVVMFIMDLLASVSALHRITYFSTLPISPLRQLSLKYFHDCFNWFSKLYRPPENDLFNVAIASIANDTKVIAAYVQQVPNQPVVFSVSFWLIRFL